MLNGFVNAVARVNVVCVLIEFRFALMQSAPFALQHRIVVDVTPQNNCFLFVLAESELHIYYIPVTYGTYLLMLKRRFQLFDVSTVSLTGF